MFAKLVLVVSLSGLDANAYSQAEPFKKEQSFSSEPNCSFPAQAISWALPFDLLFLALYYSSLSDHKQVQLFPLAKKILTLEALIFGYGHYFEEFCIEDARDLNKTESIGSRHRRELQESLLMTFSQGIFAETLSIALISYPFKEDIRRPMNMAVHLWFISLACSAFSTIRHLHKWI